MRIYVYKRSMFSLSSIAAHTSNIIPLCSHVRMQSISLSLALGFTIVTDLIEQDRRCVCANYAKLLTRISRYVLTPPFSNGGQPPPTCPGTTYRGNRARLGDFRRWRIGASTPPPSPPAKCTRRTVEAARERREKQDRLRLRCALPRCRATTVGSPREPTLARIHCCYQRCLIEQWIT